jgi:hypothetical protein
MNKNDETPRKKFQRIATLRTNNVIKGLQSLAKLSNPRNYSYSKSELNKIFSAINNEVRVARAMFDKHQRDKFEL